MSSWAAREPLNFPPLAVRRQVAMAVTWGWYSMKRLILGRASAGRGRESNLNSRKVLSRTSASALSTRAAGSVSVTATHTRGRRRGRKRATQLVEAAVMIGERLGILTAGDCQC